MLADISIIIPSLPIRYSPRWRIQIIQFLEEGINIIISIPPNNKANLNRLLDIDYCKYPNLFIFESQYRGQVLQRYEASRIVQTRYCMFMDDDIILNLEDLKSLFAFFKTNYSKYSAIAPRLLATSNGTLQSVPTNESLSDFLRILVLFLFTVLIVLMWIRYMERYCPVVQLYPFQVLIQLM